MLPLGELLAAAAAAAGCDPSRQQRRLMAYVEQMCGLVTTAGDEIGGVLLTLPTVATLLAGLLQLKLPTTTATSVVSKSSSAMSKGGCGGCNESPSQPVPPQLQPLPVDWHAAQCAKLARATAPALRVEALLALQQAALRPAPPPLAPPKPACAAFVRAVGRELTDVLLGALDAAASAAAAAGGGLRAAYLLGGATALPP